MNLIQAFIWNVGTCRADVKRKMQVGSHKCESSDAAHRGGAICSSEEHSVMELERRDCVVQLWSSEQPVMGGLT